MNVFKCVYVWERQKGGEIERGELCQLSTTVTMLHNKLSQNLVPENKKLLFSSQVCGSVIRAG